MAAEKITDGDPKVMMGIIYGQLEMVISTLNYFKDKLECITLTVDALNGKVGYYIKETNEHFKSVDERQAIDFKHIKALELDIRNEPAKKRKFWITVAQYATMMAGSVGTVIALFKGGVIK
jgi:hypothetical protein